MQIASARVVAKASPVRHHPIYQRRSKRVHIGKGIDKAPVIRNDRRNLRLLKHDFRQPDTVGVAGLLPWQIVPAFFFLPRDNAVCELRHV